MNHGDVHHSNNSTAVTLLIAAAAAVMSALFCSSRSHHDHHGSHCGSTERMEDEYDYHQQHKYSIQDYEARIAKLEETRRAERTGRIRAEMKLRSILKNEPHNRVNLLNGVGNETESVAMVESGMKACRADDDVNVDANVPSPGLTKDDDLCLNSGNTESKENLQHNVLQLQPIGMIVSPYTKRMGTPRQGAIVPSGRGFVQLTGVPMECLEGIEYYSHAWIIFSFHANTDVQRNNISNNNAPRIQLSKTKIRPPRANGVKVGMLATRSPHRPNNIGLSLVRISNLDKKHKRLHITALDLVNGTPVYDIKPVVPWDVPGQYDNIPLTVPNYVSQDEDRIGNVQFTTIAHRSLENCIRNGKMSPLYTIENNGLEEAKNAICQILAQDPRATNSNKLNKRGSSTLTIGATASIPSNGEILVVPMMYKMLFCSVEIEFQVGNKSEKGDSNDYCGEAGVVVSVENVNDNFDLTTVEHVDGIPILFK